MITPGEGKALGVLSDLWRPAYYAGFYFSPEKEKVPLPVNVGRSKMLK